MSSISAHGIWIFLGDREVFLSFKKFPWFKKAAIGAVLEVQRPQPHHLYWPELDIDLAVDSLDHPERYPLVSRERVKSTPRGKTPPRRKPTGRSR